MGLEQRMQNTPEGNLQRKEAHDRQHMPLEMRAGEYAKEAAEVIAGKDVIARDAVARFATSITETQSASEQDENTERLLKALSGRPGIFDRIPDDKDDRAAFAYALSVAHLNSLH